MLARFSRVLPLLIVLAVIAVIAYLVITYKHSPNRAKEILIKAFTWITGIISGFFALACAYALLESNEPVFDLAFSFFIAGLIGLAVTRVCHLVFVRHHPHWKSKPVKTTHPDDKPRCPYRPPWAR